MVTDEKPQELRVDLEDHEGEAVYATYGFFQIASQELKFGLSVGTYHGTAGEFESIRLSFFENFIKCVTSHQ